MNLAGEATKLDASMRDQICQFLYTEADLQDRNCYSEWEMLWADDDCLYWVPMDELADPATSVSYIYDNRQRLASRVRQLNTGMRHSQSPRSNLSRVISNIQCTMKEDEVHVRFKFHLTEARHERLVTWAGRVEQTLLKTPSGYRIKFKKVLLVNGREIIPNLTFLI